MPRPITPRTTLDGLKHEAKAWLKAIRAGDPGARARLDRAIPGGSSKATLRQIQHALAREHGLPGWSALARDVAAVGLARGYERVAAALEAAFRTADDEAMGIVREYFGHRRTRDAFKRYVRLELGRPEQASAGDADAISLDEARYLVARAQGFESWEALVRMLSTLPRGARLAARSVEMFDAAAPGAGHAARRSHLWDEVVDVLRQQRLSGLDARGQMTDALLDRVTRVDHLTRLDLAGSTQLTDQGLRCLARLPGLRHLDLGGCGRVTDRGLDVLRQLPALETLVLAGTPITDAGTAALEPCQRLRHVDLMGTATGDGALRSLSGKPGLSDLRSGDEVTDAGLALLDQLPVFRSWHGGERRMALLSFDAGPNYLLLRGRFGDDGLTHLTALEGLYALNLDSRQLGLTSRGLAALSALPHLEWLGANATDESMPAIAALPHLRFLMCQDTTAGDDGFAALGRSQTIEYLWGRRCHNLRRRGFLGLAAMPALRALSVSCLNVDDEGLAALPGFPALRELMPMDVPDHGYRHVGRCGALESLILMYCRETTDAATGHLTGLSRLTTYFASYTRITDRTPALLGTMPTLEEITLDTCVGLTDTGIAALAGLPRLRRLSLSGMPRVTREAAARFPGRVAVRFSP